jgi:hypothetical protein
MDYRTGKEAGCILNMSLFILSEVFINMYPYTENNKATGLDTPGAANLKNDL